MDGSAQKAKWEEKVPQAVQKYFSPDGINEQKGLCNDTNFLCHMNV